MKGVIFLWHCNATKLHLLLKHFSEGGFLDPTPIILEIENVRRTQLSVFRSFHQLSPPVPNFNLTCSFLPSVPSWSPAAAEGSSRPPAAPRASSPVPALRPHLGRAGPGWALRAGGSRLGPAAPGAGRLWVRVGSRGAARGSAHHAGPRPGPPRGPRVLM